MSLQGQDKVIANISAIFKSQPQKLGAAFYQEGQSIITEAKQETPVDLGTLRSTGHVELPVITATEVKVELGFGGPAAPYALIVHEDLNAQHTVGGAKYLENPWNRHKVGMVDRIAKRVEAELK